MPKIFDKLENRRAFRKALKEIKSEKPVVKKNSVTKVYGNEPETVASSSGPRYQGPLSKPNTAVVDLKNFKDWRNVDKVQSESPEFKGKLFEEPRPAKAFNSAAAYREEIERPNINRFMSGNPVEERESVPGGFNANMLGRHDTETPEERMQRMLKNLEERRRAASARLKEIEGLEAKPEPKVEVKQQKPETVVSEIKQEPMVEQKPAPKVTAPEQPIKVEPKPAPVKKVTNRKPRGKGKKRFDVDVITSIDWR